MVFEGEDEVEVEVEDEDGDTIEVELEPTMGSDGGSTCVTTGDTWTQHEKASNAYIHTHLRTEICTTNPTVEGVTYAGKYLS